jgi:hypothetical protein
MKRQLTVILVSLAMSQAFPPSPPARANAPASAAATDFRIVNGKLYNARRSESWEDIHGSVTFVQSNALVVRPSVYLKEVGRIVERPRSHPEKLSGIQAAR